MFSRPADLAELLLDLPPEEPARYVPSRSPRGGIAR
jgi:hypothetical protein